MGHKINGNVGSESLRRIQEVLNNLEHKTKATEKVKPNWDKEIKYIKQGGGNPIPVNVTCDVFIHN
jgi:Type II restriction endonuclease, TdeIII